jgi:hypothetical protein
VRVAGRRRTAWLTGVATVAAVLWLTGNFGVVDFVDGFTGFVGQARNQVLDVGWGAVFGVIVPLGLLSQLRRPERRIAGIQQTGIVAAALAAGLRSRSPGPPSRWGWGWGCGRGHARIRSQPERRLRAGD